MQLTRIISRDMRESHLPGRRRNTVIRFPNPFTALSEIVAKAFAIVGDRDRAGGRGAFGVGLSHTSTRRRARVV